jgi:hypothetical protein
MPSITDIVSQACQVRKVHNRTHAPRQTASPFNHLLGAGEQRVGTSKPRAMAALRLIINSNSVGCRTGMVCGLFALQAAIG